MPDIPIGSAEFTAAEPRRGGVVRSELADDRNRVLRRAYFVALTIAVVAGAASLAVVDQLLYTGDEVAHIDYAVAVWNGALPNFYEGLDFRPPVPAIPPVQWVSQHPPLFYLLAAPLVGPAANADSWILAASLARFFTVLVAAALVPSVVWMCRRALPRASWAAVAFATAVVCLSAPVLLLASAFYNDLLAFVFAALIVGASLTVLRSGARRHDVVLLGLLSAGALGTRVMTMPFVVLAVVAAAVAGFLGSETGTRFSAAVARGARPAGAVLGLAVLPNAWFYGRNLRVFGTITGGDPEWAAANLGRQEKPARDIVLDPGFWRSSTTLLSPRRGEVGTLALWLLVAIVLTLSILAARMYFERMKTKKATAADVCLPFVVIWIVASTLAIQVIHRSGGGGLNWRYALPLLIPVALLLCATFDRLGRLRLPAILSFIAAWAWWSPVPRSVLSYFDDVDVLVTPLPRVVVIGVAAVFVAACSVAGWMLTALAHRRV